MGFGALFYMWAIALPVAYQRCRRDCTLFLSFWRHSRLYFLLERMVILEKEYVVRKIDPSTPRRVTPLRSRPPRKRRGRGDLPIWLLVVAAIAVVAGIVLLIWRPWAKGEDKTQEEDTSSAVMQATPNPADYIPQSVASDVSSPESEPTAPMPDQAAPDAAPELYDSLAVVDGAGYGLYKFSEDNTNEYIQLVCDAADYLPDWVTLYEMIVPTSLDVMLTESYITGHEIDSSDQRKAIEDYIYPSIHNLHDGVKTVSLFDPLRAHCDEYIYYRSDPLWTQLGAYYAYVEFCKAAGLDAIPLDDFELESYDGYLGSYYHTSQDSEMAANTDTVEAYMPFAKASLSFINNEGAWESDWAVIQDGEGYNPEWLNLIFMAGGQSYAEITNEDLDDGSACILVSESFSNTFAPFLLNHYQYVYVVDYRYYSGSIPDLAEEVAADDVILLNNITSTSDESRISDLSSVF